MSSTVRNLLSQRCQMMTTRPTQQCTCTTSACGASLSSPSRSFCRGQVSNVSPAGLSVQSSSHLEAASSTSCTFAQRNIVHVFRLLASCACMRSWASSASGAVQARVLVNGDSLPYRDKRNEDGRLFAASAADVSPLLPAEGPLTFPVELGSLRYPLAFPKASAIPFHCRHGGQALRNPNNGGSWPYSEQVTRNSSDV